MKIILLQNIKGVGRMGDIKNVSDGYGRNYLLANKLAKLATSGTVYMQEGIVAYEILLRLPRKKLPKNYQRQSRSKLRPERLILTLRHLRQAQGRQAQGKRYMANISNRQENISLE